MTCIRWSMALLGLCLGTAEGRAQAILYPGPYDSGYYGGAGGANLRLGRSRPARGLKLSLGAFVRRGYLLDPFGPGCYSSVTRVTVLYPVRPTILVVPGRLPPDEDLPPDSPRREPGALGPLDPLPGGQPRGRFRPLAPENRERAGRPLPAEDEVKPPPPRPPREDAPKPPPPRPPKEAPNPPPPKNGPRELPRPPLPDHDPGAENARLIDLGREAFANLEYGRAALRFRQAAGVLPRDALAHFLLAQALLAQGKYHEAVDAVYAGVARRPDWPTARFLPLELYGPHVAEYPEHLALLEDVVGRHPDDPVLLFLCAYQLWFDGRREEARPLFRRALPRAADPGVIERFLRALPPARAV